MSDKSRLDRLLRMLIVASFSRNSLRLKSESCRVAVLR